MIVLIGLCGAILVVGSLVHEVWRLSERAHPGRPLRVLVIASTSVACAASTLPRISSAFKVVSDFNFFVFTIVLAAVVAGGSIATLFNFMDHDRVIGVRLAVAAAWVFFALQVISATANNQLFGFNSKILTLILFPGLLTLIVGSGMSRDQMVRLAGTVSRWVVWVSLTLFLVVPGAVTHGNRRVPLPFLDQRIGGITPHPELLAITAAVMIFTSLWTRERIWGLHIAAAIVALVVSESRVSAGAILVALAVAGLLRRGSVTTRLVLATPVLAVVGFYLWDHPNLWSTVEEQGTASTGIASGLYTLNNRTEVWRMVATNARSHIFGWGPAAFDDSAISPFAPTFYLNAHSQYYEGLAEGGWLGLACTLAIAFVLLRMVVTRRGGSLVGAACVFTLITMLTEVPFTLHLYGSSYTNVAACLLMLVTFGAASGGRTSDSSLALHAYEYSDWGGVRVGGRQHSGTAGDVNSRPRPRAAAAR
jgi:hypothetical protein